MHSNVSICCKFVRCPRKSSLAPKNVTGKKCGQRRRELKKFGSGKLQFSNKQLQISTQAL